MPEFRDLPFFERPDLTPYIVHLTKNTRNQEDGRSAFRNLVNILRTGEIWGSTTESGFIRGSNAATCFMDVPFASLKYVLNPRDADPADPRYEPYGIVITKKYAYEHDCRPVLYLSHAETRRLGIPNAELWRVVTFQVRNDNWTSWLHEREWRCKGDFEMPGTFPAVLVKSAREAQRLGDIIRRDPDSFEAKPRSIIPLDVICQGLPQIP